jgi:hypothetical protein
VIVDDSGPLLEKEMSWPPDRRLAWGLISLVLWLLLFAIGVLIPSENSRIRLGWRPDNEKRDATKLREEVDELKNKLTTAKDDKNQTTQSPSIESKVSTDDLTSVSPGGASPGASEKPTIAENPDTKQILQEIRGLSEDLKRQNDIKARAGGGLGDFLIASCSYMPINIGLLCILAAFMGGCSVNKNSIFDVQSEIATLQPGERLYALKRRLGYLTEHPGYSTIRGLVVYLILISGLFIVGATPEGGFGEHQEFLSQYMRLAGLFSFVGFLTGYDPTVFTSMLSFGSNRIGNNSGNPSGKA